MVKTVDTNKTLVELSRTTVISDCGTTAINVKNGTVLPLSESAKKRLDELRNSPQSVIPADLELLERGIIQFGVHASRENSQYSMRVRRFLDQSGGLCVMPTEKCNLRCTYCYEKFVKGRMRNDLVDAICSFLEQHVPRYRFYQLAWFGGEPLLHPDILNKVNNVFRKLTTDTGTHGTISITTNGTLFTPQVIGLISRDSVCLCQVTLDGPSEIHDSQRKTIHGLGTYEKVLDGIERVLNKTSTTILLRVNVHSENQEQCRIVREWLSSEVVPRFLKYRSRVKYNVVSIWNATTRSISGICIADVQRFLNWIMVSEATWSHGEKGPLFDFLKILGTTGSIACYAGKPNHYVIGADGTVYKCTVALDLEENKIGKLVHNGVIATDKDREQVWLSKNSITDPVCGACALREPCMGIACPLVRIQTSQQPCPTEKKYLPLYLTRLTSS